MKNTIVTAAALAAFGLPALAGNLAPAPAEPQVYAPAPVAAPAGTDWSGPYAGAQLGYGFGEASGTDLEGVIGGVFGGYNYDFGQFVVGGEADFSIADLQIDGSSDTIDKVGRLKLRAGVDAGRALFYATAGGAYASADVGGSSASDFGYVVGAGVDMKITDSMFAGVEYLYHGFDDFDNTGADVSVNTVSARIGLNF